jgi:Domain of unknown function (DUF4397)/Sortase domain
VLVAALGVSPAAADDVAMLRVAHLSPDTPAVDVALTPLPPAGPVTDPGPDLVTGLGYGATSDYAEVPAGSYAVSLRAAGAPRSAPPVLSARIDMPAGGARTVRIGGLFADLDLQALPEDLSAPPSGTARVRVLSAAAGARSLDVGLDGGSALATDLPFGGAGSAVQVPAGPATVRVDGGPEAVAALPVTWTSGSISTLLVLDDPGGGLTVRVVRDAAGPAVVPTGAVEAGGGGGAGLPAALPWVAVTAGAVALGSRRGRVLAVAAAAAVAAAPAVAPTMAPTLAPATGQAVPLSVEGAPPAAAAPVRLQVPSAGIDTAVVAVDLDAAGALVPPSGDGAAGWYRQGPTPGDLGPAVLTGHVDSVAGPAVFFRLRDVTVGDPVLVGRADGTTLRFTVTRVASYPKAAFPGTEVYRPTPGAELRLITCGGTFDRAARSYLDNVVVYARLS